MPSNVHLPIREGEWGGQTAQRSGGGDRVITVWNPLPHTCQDEVHHPADLVANVTGPQPDYANTLRRQPSCPPSVVRSLFLAEMRRPIDLNSQLHPRTIEVEDVGPDRMLSSELHPVQPRGAQPNPQTRFRRRHLTAENLGARIAQAIGHSATMPRITSGVESPSPDRRRRRSVLSIRLREWRGERYFTNPLSTFASVLSCSRSRSTRGQSANIR